MIALCSIPMLPVREELIYFFYADYPYRPDQNDTLPCSSYVFMCGGNKTIYSCGDFEVSDQHSCAACDHYSILSIVL